MEFGVIGPPTRAVVHVTPAGVVTVAPDATRDELKQALEQLIPYIMQRKPDA